MNKKLLSRFMLCFSLIVSLIFSSNMPVMAAGTETWSQSVGPTEYMRIVNNNTTPVKTIGKAGTLTIENWITRCNSNYCNCSDQEPTSYSQINVHIQIISYDTGEILADGWFREHNVFAQSLSTTRSLRVGERVRIFFDICSLNNPPGPYRKAHISYRYKIN